MLYNRPFLSFTHAIAVLIVLSQARLAFPANTAELFSYNPYLFVSVGTSESDPATAPLAAADVQQAFDRSYAQIISDAKSGTNADRQATIELLRRKAGAKEISPGLRRLLLVAAFDLAKSGAQDSQKMPDLAVEVLEVLNDRSLVCVRARVDLLATVAKLNLKANGFDSADVAQAIFDLSAIQAKYLSAAKALETLQIGEQWAKKDPFFAESRAKWVDSLRNALQSEIEVDKKLAASPQDPDANETKGLLQMQRPNGLRSAVPFLLKSSRKEFQRVGTALQATKVGAKERLELAAAISECLPLLKGEQQTGIADLIRTQVQDVANDSASSEAERTRAELLTIKAEQILARTEIKPATKASVPATIASTQNTSRPASTTAEVAEDVVSFLGVKSAGKRIVYIVDTDDSLGDIVKETQVALIQSITQLSPIQKFAIVTVGSNVQIFAPDKLPRRADGRSDARTATGVAKEDATAAILKMRLVKAPLSTLDDEKLAFFSSAFKMALDLEPDVIFFTTHINTSSELPDTVTKLTRGKSVTINAIALENGAEEYQKVLSKLAKQNRGVFKFVDPTEMDAFSTKHADLLKPVKVQPNGN